MKKFNFILLLVIILCAVLMLNQSTAWSQESPVAKLKREYNVTNITFDKKGIPTFIKGDLTPKGIQGDEKEKTYKFFEENRELFKMVDPRNELQIARIAKDELGMTHVRLNQLYKGIKVYGSELITHFTSSGKLKSINGRFLSGINAPNTPRIGKAEAKGIALSDILSNFKIAKPEVSGTQLIIYPIRDVTYLAWLVKISFDNPPGRWEYFINAFDGTVIYKANRITYKQEQSGGKKHKETGSDAFLRIEIGPDKVVRVYNLRGELVVGDSVKPFTGDNIQDKGILL